MTVQIDVMTTFADMSAFAEGYLERVDGTYLVLPAPMEVADGEWVNFSIKLVDGSAVLEGVGKASGQRDHGEEYGAERYDLWLAELQIAEGMSEVAWERIVLAREQQQSGDRPTGEVNLADVEAARSEAPPAAEAGAQEWDKDSTSTDEAARSEPPAVMEELEEEATVATTITSVETRTPAAAPPPAPRARPAGAAPKPAPPPPAPSGLTRPTAAVSWHPVADPPRGTGQGSGVFEYGDEGLPVPPQPPRPEGDIARVAAAPRPAS